MTHVKEAGSLFLKSLLNSYASVFFSKNPWFGALLILVTFLHPSAGLAGLLIPVFPAKYEEAAAGYQRSIQGAKEYLGSANPELRAKLANAAENDHLPLLTRAETPVMQKIFNLQYKGAKETEQTFLVTAESHKNNCPFVVLCFSKLAGEFENC